MIGGQVQALHQLTPHPIKDTSATMEQHIQLMATLVLLPDMIQ
jgi:ABC-type uncharacterized transport system ATPase subunit